MILYWMADRQIQIDYHTITHTITEKNPLLSKDSFGQKEKNNRVNDQLCFD